jgi:hypothetical protein
MSTHPNTGGYLGSLALECLIREPRSVSVAPLRRDGPVHTPWRSPSGGRGSQHLDVRPVRSSARRWRPSSRGGRGSQLPRHHWPAHLRRARGHGRQTAEARPGEALTAEPSVHKPRWLDGGQTGPVVTPSALCGVAYDEVLRAASMTSLVITVRSLVRRMRSIRANSRCRSRKLPPVMRAIAAMAWLSVKPAPSRVRPSWPSSPGQPATAARAGRAGRLAPGGGERSSVVITNLLR